MVDGTSLARESRIASKEASVEREGARRLGPSAEEAQHRYRSPVSVRRFIDDIEGCLVAPAVEGMVGLRENAPRIQVRSLFQKPHGGLIDAPSVVAYVPERTASSRARRKANRCLDQGKEPLEQVV